MAQIKKNKKNGRVDARFYNLLCFVIKSQINKHDERKILPCEKAFLSNDSAAFRHLAFVGTTNRKQRLSVSKI